MARRVRLAIGLRSTAQSLSFIGKAASTFEQSGIDLEVAQVETAGPVGAAGLFGGDWDIAEFGAVPVVQWALEGHDPVILLAAEPISALYILGGKGIGTPKQLVGSGVGVLTRAGQTGFSALQMLRRWGLPDDQVNLIEMLRYPDIFEALRAGRIGAGVLTADYRFAAAEEDGLTVLADLGTEFRFQGPVVATTRRFIDRNRDVVTGIVRGYCLAVHAFKMRPHLAIQTLRKHLFFTNASAVERIHAFYAQRFSRIPRASNEGIQAVLDSCRKTGCDSNNLRAMDLNDTSFIDQLEREGLFDALYRS